MEFFGKKMRFGPAKPEEKPLVAALVELSEENRIGDLENALLGEHAKYLEEQRAKDHADLTAKHEIEPMTGLKRRQVFERELDAALKVIRGEAPEKRATQLNVVSVVMIDLDHFKKVNDTFGHAAGDEVLQRVSQILLDSVRPADVATLGREEEGTEDSAVDTVARYGGEELIVLMPGATAEVAARHAEEIRRKIAELTFDQEKYPGLAVTASFGVAASSPSVLYPAQLLKNADDVLYQAKGNGRNRVETYSDA